MPLTAHHRCHALPHGAHLLPVLHHLTRHVCGRPGWRLRGSRTWCRRRRGRLLSLRESLQSADEKGGSPDEVAKVIGTALTASSPAPRYPVGTAATLASAVKPWIPDKLYDAVVRRTV